MTFILFHGSFNSYNQINEYWLPKLKFLDQKVIYPRFPTDTWDEISANGPDIPPKKQSLNSWLQVFDSYYEEIKNKKDLVFVGHSSGPLFILHVLQKYHIQLNSAVFVSPFLKPLSKSSWQTKLINKSYYFDKFDFNLLRRLCPFSYVVYGTNDPYVETENSKHFADQMGSTVIPVINGGHLNREENSQLIVELCKSRGVIHTI